MLYPRLIPTVIGSRKLRQPEGIVYLHSDLRAGAAHRGAGLAEQLLHLAPSRPRQLRLLA